jgi:hypothetical protein
MVDRMHESMKIGCHGKAPWTESIPLSAWGATLLRLGETMDKPFNVTAE